MTPALASDFFDCLADPKAAEFYPMNIAPTGRPPFRADHIGSLLRPVKLRQAFQDVLARKTSEAAFRAIQDDAIRGIVKLQEDVGLQVVNDGEFRRGSY